MIRWYDRGFTIIYRPPRGKRVEALHTLSEIILDAAIAGGGRQQMLLFVEELPQAFPSEKLPAHLGGFSELVLTGRNFGVGVVGIAQRAALVSTVFTGNTDEVYVFRPSEEPDYERARQMLGRQYDAKIRGLLNRDYIFKDKTTGRVTEFKFKH